MTVIYSQVVGPTPKTTMNLEKANGIPAYTITCSKIKQNNYLPSLM
jgi:hypothetical protein